jgi:hypothetical protein
MPSAGDPYTAPDFARPALVTIEVQRDFRIVPVHDAISGLYERREQEPAGTGVCLMDTFAGLSAPGVDRVSPAQSHVQTDRSGDCDGRFTSVTRDNPGRGYALSHLEDLGHGPGFARCAEASLATAFGVSAIILPAGTETSFHYHDVQEELYFGIGHFLR